MLHAIEVLGLKALKDKAGYRTRDAALGDFLGASGGALQTSTAVTTFWCLGVSGGGGFPETWAKQQRTWTAEPSHNLPKMLNVLG